MSKLEEIKKTETGSGAVSSLLLNTLQLCMITCPEGVLHFCGGEPRGETARLLASITSLLANPQAALPLVVKDSFSRELHLLQRRVHTLDGSPPSLPDIFEFFPCVVLDQHDASFLATFIPNLRSPRSIILCCEWAVSSNRKGDHCPLVVATMFHHWLMAQPAKASAEAFLQVGFVVPHSCSRLDLESFPLLLLLLVEFDCDLFGSV